MVGKEVRAMHPETHRENLTQTDWKPPGITCMSMEL